MHGCFHGWLRTFIEASVDLQICWSLRSGMTRRPFRLRRSMSSAPNKCRQHARPMRPLPAISAEASLMASLCRGRQGTCFLHKLIEPRKAASSLLKALKPFPFPLEDASPSPPSKSLSPDGAPPSLMSTDNASDKVSSRASKLALLLPSPTILAAQSTLVAGATHKLSSFLSAPHLSKLPLQCTSQSSC